MLVIVYYLAGSAGFFAYDALGHGLSHVDATSGADLNHVNVSGGHLGATPKIANPMEDIAKNIGKPVEHVYTPSSGVTTNIGNSIVTPHASIEAVADHGQGAISTLKELQHNLKAEYGNNLDNAPASVKHILNTDANKLAEEYGMYKPGQDAESVLIKSGSSFRVDGSGNVSYHEVSGHDTILEKGVEVKASNVYEGKMMDTDNSGLKVDQVPPSKISASDVLDKKVGTEGSSSITETSASIAVTNELIGIYQHNITHLFPDNNIKIWDDIKNISAEKFMDTYKGDNIKDVYSPLVSYVHKLEEVSGLKPNTETLVSPAESVTQFIGRALKKIQEAGQLDKVTL